MKSTVIPFSMTAMGIKEISLASQEFLGRNPIRKLDSSGIKPNTPRGVLLFLESWTKDKIDLKEVESSLEHFSMSFAVFNEDERTILDLCRFIRVHQSISKEETAVILTATLAEWKDVLVSTSTIIKSKTFDYTEIRSVLNTIYNFFEQASLSEIFTNYRKQPLQDSTFYLEEK